MKRIYRLGLVLLILISCVGCDQATKRIAKEALTSASPITLLNGLVRMEYDENPGAFLGFGATWPSEIRFLLFAVFVSGILALTWASILNRRDFNLGQLTGLSLVAAGGAGNLSDRLFHHGMVVDFLQIGIGPVRTGIFNLADVAILVGISIFVLESARRRHR